MRVVFISHEDSIFGAPKSLMELIVSLREYYNVEPILFLHSRDNVYNFCKKNNIECYVTCHRNIVAGKRGMISTVIRYIPKKMANFLLDYYAIIKTRKVFNNMKVDIIHSNVSIISLGIKLSKIYNVKHVMHLREPASAQDEYVFTTTNYIKKLNRNVDEFVAISKHNKQQWEDKGIDSNKLHLIYNGLAIQNSRADLRNNGKLRIVMIGSFSEHKGQHILIDAIKILSPEERKKIHVDFIGKGFDDYYNTIVNDVNDSQLCDYITFKGYIDNAKSLIAEYNIGIIASDHESFGRVTVEYMSNGLYVIASDRGANTELIQDGVNGAIFCRNCAYDLAEKIRIAINNREMMISLAQKAREDANKFYSIRVNARNVYSLYESMVLS